jgi:hypothetical protein
MPQLFGKSYSRRLQRRIDTLSRLAGTCFSKMALPVVRAWNFAQVHSASKLLSTRHGYGYAEYQGGPGLDPANGFGGALVLATNRFWVAAHRSRWLQQYLRYAPYR